MGTSIQALAYTMLKPVRTNDCSQLDSNVYRRHIEFQASKQAQHRYFQQTMSLLMDGSLNTQISLKKKQRKTRNDSHEL